MDRSMELVRDETDKYMFVCSDPTNRSNLAISLPQRVVPREFIAIVNVYDSSDLNITSQTEGLSYSSQLDSWYRYIPPGESGELRSFASLNFPSPAKRLSVQLYNWNKREQISAMPSSTVVCVYETNTPNALSRSATNVLFSNGGQYLG